MSNEGFFELGLLDVRSQPAKDDKVTVRFFRNRDGSIISKADKLAFPAIHRFKLPAFPQEQSLHAEVLPSRFRHRDSGFFTLTDGEIIQRNLTVFRQPDKWKAQFVPWNLLKSGFMRLKDTLEFSPGIKVKKGRTLDSLAGDAYDRVTEEKTVLAKAALLNLYAKLEKLKEPLSNEDSWFSFVRQIILIDRERFIAFVDPRMAEIVQAIKDDIKRFDFYKHTPAANHFEGVQKAVPDGFKVLKSRMLSVKTDENKSNVQLTIAPTRSPEGNEVTVLDADIDENGNLLRHALDVFKHKFSGGTHPFDIHDYLLLSYSDIELGYELV